LFDSTHDVCAFDRIIDFDREETVRVAAGSDLGTIIMMAKPLQPMPDAGVNEALHELLAEVQTLLGAHFVGMYLVGSLAVGDFDPPTSDIDLVFVTDAPLSDDLFVALQAVHARVAAGGSPWARRLEAVYVPAPALRHGAPSEAKSPVLERGRALALEPLESAWSVQRFTLREHGRAVAGPEPRTLLDAVDPDEMRREGVAIAREWLEKADTDPSWLAWFRRRDSQAFVVLTLCRLLYTLETGTVASKPAAARWAQPMLGPRWTGLIERALAGQKDPSEIAESEVDESLALIRHTVEQFRKWEASTPG
jgi:predicted nucleotidyltransferase